jgi:hypothetical protein
MRPASRPCAGVDGNPPNRGAFPSKFLLPKFSDDATLSRIKEKPIAMEKPNSLELPSNTETQKRRLARLLTAAGELDGLSKFGIICIFFAWFFIDTLVVSVGSVKHGVRFFDASAVIADPTRMFFSIDTSFGVIVFALVCCLCLMGPLAPHIWRNRLAWLAYLLPLILIVVCGLLLYSKTSGEIVATPGDASGLRGSVMTFANKILQRGSDLVSRHVAVGAGGYVALLGSLVLGYQGMRRFLHRPS